MGWPAGLLTGEDGGHAADRAGQRRTLGGGDSAEFRHFRNDAEYGPGVASRPMKKVLHLAIAAAVVLHLIALVVQGQSFLPGF